MRFEFMIIWSCVFVLASIASWTDIKTRLIPNWLNLSGAVIGLIIGAVSGNFLYHLYGLLWGFGLGFLMYLMKGAAEGDGKLFAAIGSLVGPSSVVLTILMSVAVFVLVWAPVRMRREGIVGFFRNEYAGLLSWMSGSIPDGEKNSVPFAPFVLSGSVLAFLLQLFIFKGGIIL